MDAHTSPNDKTHPARALRRWLPLVALLVAVALALYFWKALLFLAVFCGAWIASALFVLRMKQRKAVALGGGLIVALLAVSALSALIGGNSTALANAETLAPTVPTVPAKSAPKRYRHAQAGTPVYFFKPLYADKPRCSFEYETLPSGAVRFIDAYDHREYCMTQPFEMKERPLPESAVKDGPADMAEKERAMNEPLKYYLVTSYATVKGYRYSTFRYAIDHNGTVHFDQRGSKLAIPPPYIIEENFVGKGNHPKIPDYPPSPDRG